MFTSSLPHAFVHDYIHWYDVNVDEVIFCPRDNPWTACGDEWRLKRRGAVWRLVKDANTLVNFSSPTAHTLSKVFNALEDAQHIHMVLGPDSRALFINLHRLRLDFFIEHRHHQILSRQYREMAVDDDQVLEFWWA